MWGHKTGLGDSPPKIAGAADAVKSAAAATGRVSARISAKG
jgi:hypothetical protein